MSSNLNWLGNKGLDPNTPRNARSPLSIPDDFDFGENKSFWDELLNPRGSGTRRSENEANMGTSEGGKSNLQRSNPQKGSQSAPERSDPPIQPDDSPRRQMPMTDRQTESQPRTSQRETPMRMVPIDPMSMDITDPSIPVQQGPPPATEEGFIPAFLRRNIGRYVRAEFILGTNQYTDRTGRIIEVGTNYFVLEDVNARTEIMCDLYAVKFVTILPRDSMG
ncbi:MAG: hypothetical protein ACOX1Q_07680 [Eubacteriales bacterium]|jgi:hypothetical protein